MNWCISIELQLLHTCLTKSQELARERGFQKSWLDSLIAANNTEQSEKKREMLVFHDHSFSTSGIWNSQEFASSFLCLRNRILFFSSLFLLFSQTAWSLINLGGFCSMFKKRQLATDKTKILFILKIRTRILMIMAMRYSRSVQILCASKKSNNGEIIGGEWDRIRVI